MQADENIIYDFAILVKDNIFFYPEAASNSMVMWDMDSQQPVGRLEGQDAQIRVVGTRGNLAISAHSNGALHLWNLETTKCTATLPMMPDVWSICCMEGRVLLASDGPIKLWDVAASAPVALPDMVGHTKSVYGIKTSERMFLSGSADKTVRLWDLRTGKCVRIMEEHSRSVLSVDMDGHCRTAVSGSREKTVKLWDLGSGRCMETYEGHPEPIRDVVMHESGSSFMSAGWDDFSINAWVVGSTKPSVTADFTASCPSTRRGSRLFASRDLSKVAYCCLSEGKLDLRYWK